MAFGSKAGKIVPIMSLLHRGGFTPRTRFLDTLIQLQTWLYGGMSSSLKATGDVSGLPSLMAAGFLFGIVHALMPGHGKSVLVSYHAGTRGRFIDGIVTGSLLALTHIGLAVVLVLAGVAVISRSVAAAGRAPAFEVASAALIVAVGLYLLYRALMHANHEHTRDGRSLAVAAGFIPCPLTTFVLFYAIAHDKLIMGFAAVGGMLAGVAVTISTFALAAIFARERLIHVLQASVQSRKVASFWLELMSAVALIALGVVKLSEQIR